MPEVPYELPKGWKWVKLGEVAEVKYGKARPPQSGSIPVVGSGGVYAYTKKPLISVPTVIVGRKGSAGEPILMREPCWPSDTTFYLVWKLDIYPEWVVLWLTLNKPSPTGTSATLPSIRRQDLEKHLLPLPPLKEQRRIVSRIEELMERVREARRLREEAKKDADRLMQAALAEVFPRPGDSLSPGWRWAKLGEVCEHKSGIWGPKAKAPADGFPIVRSTEIAGHRIDPQSASIRSVPLGKAQRYALQSGDILINKSSGSPHLVGWPAIFEDPGDGRMYLFSNFMLRLRVDKSRVNPWFMLYYLHSPVARANYLGAQDTTSGLRNLRVRDFMAQPIPLPPLPKQRRIVVYLDQIQARVGELKKAQKSTEAELHCLEQAILDKAFRGEL